ncbi:MAG: hypothetical protein G01um101448_328 [Parcubacteria group bacterium Gr01-1014_48]|nr:MAG: hypothetical protein Greene041614_902 [Parcubacteria group bacterium Greene0416_14]TSC74124.1 MAG: hypothetical protein G01um101448_328 [Parcubacteria group bacterium Gr01-1014_48]TSD00168.1 MAG: hypothetical protein Greene101415_944 [Parcubacteria group bacterium Greene1014_15]TSD07513.1 MAG: hypothetical protein Greene07144_882 [Parcubacteria group bacterium Greene0714_4]
MNLTVISILVAGLLIGGTIMFSSGSSNVQAGAAENVTIMNGKQIVEITAKGSYAPRVSLAQANIPTVLKVKTQGTFDCTAALAVPAVAYKAMLPSTGETLIEIPPQKPGSIVQGICGMGMYNFKVRFD